MNYKIVLLVGLTLMLSAAGCNKNSTASKPKSDKSQTQIENTDSAISKAGYQKLKYSFTRKNFIHPRIIEELLGCPADCGQTVTTIDLNEANNSNRFFGKFKIKKIGQRIWVTYENEKTRESFSYCYLGASPTGTHMLLCQSCGGGSGIFTSIALLKFKKDTGIMAYFYGMEKTDRLLLHIEGEICLGDRYDGKITYENGNLKIGPDIGPQQNNNGRNKTQIIKIE